MDSNALQRSRVPLSCAGVALSRVPTCDNQLVATFPQLFAFAISEMVECLHLSQFQLHNNHHLPLKYPAKDALLQYYTTDLVSHSASKVYFDLIRYAVQMSRVLDDSLTNYNMD